MKVKVLSVNLDGPIACEVGYTREKGVDIMGAPIVNGVVNIGTGSADIALSGSGLKLKWSIQGENLGCSITTDGKVTAGNFGGTITVQAASDDEPDCYSETTLTLVKVENVTLNPTAIVADGVSTSTATATVTPSLRSLKWSIVGEAAGCSVDVDSGIVTAGNTGATVTVRAEDSVVSGAFATSTITVVKVTLTPDPVNVPLGKTATASATIEPSSAADQVEFSVETPATATVTPAVGAGSPQALIVTGVAVGATNLKAKIKQGTGTSVEAASVDVKVWPVEFDPGTPISINNWAPALDNTVAQSANRIGPMSSPGEIISFNISASDQDQKRLLPTLPWEIIKGDGSCHIDWEVQGPALFARNQQNAIRTTGLESRAVDVKIDANWTGVPAIHVKATVVDDALNPEASPATGTKHDPSIIKSWTIVLRPAKYPTDMIQRSTDPAPNAWKQSPAIYTYEMLPDGPPVNHLDYYCQTVNEDFAAPTAHNFNMDDLTQKWHDDHRDITLANDAAPIIFNMNFMTTGTFAIDDLDQIHDGHSGFIGGDAFTDAAITKGVGVSLVQTYSCAGTPIKSYTVTYRLQTRRTFIIILKTGP